MKTHLKAGAMMKQGSKKDQMMTNMMIMKKDLTGEVTGALAAV